VFHCNSCSPGGRGPRAAAWYQDWLDSNGIKTSQALVLTGGYKAWTAEYPDKLVKF
jgi:arsenical-resistance protein 2